MALLLNAGDTVSRSYSYTQPSPLRPIQPQETGERTENSFNINGTYTTQGSNSVSNNQINAKCAGSNESYMWFDDTILSGTYKLSLQFNDGLKNVRILCSKAFSGGTYNSYYGGWYASLDNGEITITVSEDFKIGFNFVGDAGATGTVYNIMFSTDTNADYEPYGYKIPISSASTTTPVYLGEVESTRRIGKYLFNGSNIFTTHRNAYRNNTALFATTVMIGTGIRNRPSMNNYFSVTSSGINPQSLDYACSGFNPQYQFSNYYYLRVPYDVIGMTDSNTDNEFIIALNTWLSSLYNSGNPMIAYYALETSETGIINEPLRKIGDYADTVSGITIPTITGKDTFDVDTSLKPSEVELAYTGWHDAEVKEWDGSQWQ